MNKWMTHGMMILALAAVCLQRCEGQLTASLDEDNFLVLEASGLDLLAVEFRSPSGSLIPSQIASPFEGVLVQDDSLALYYNLGTPFILDGSITLATKWDATKRNDIQFQYGTPTIDRALEPISGHQSFAAQVGSEPVIVTEPPGTSGTGSASWLEPVVVVSPRDDGLYFYSDSLVSIEKVDVKSTAGLLSFGDATSLFDALDFTNSFELTYHNSSAVELRGDFFLPVGWTGQQASDLTVSLTTAAGEVLSAEVDIVRSLPEPTHRVWLPLLLILALGRKKPDIRANATTL